MRPTTTEPTPGGHGANGPRELFYIWLDEERNRRSGDIPSTTKTGGPSTSAHSQPETRELIVSREDELLHIIKKELDQLRADRVLNCPTEDQCPRLDYERNAINMAEAAVDRAVRKFGERAMNFPVTDPPEWRPDMDDREIQDMCDQEARAAYDRGRDDAARDIQARILDLAKRHTEGLWLGSKWDLLPHAVAVARKYAEEVANGSAPGQPGPDPG